MKPSERIFVALRNPKPDAMDDQLLVIDLATVVGGFTVNTLVSSSGKVVDRLGKNVMLDMKFHDVPSTVYQQSLGAVRLGAGYFTVHTAGGIEMMRQAQEAVRRGVEAEKVMNSIAGHEEISVTHPKILGVTMLTSHTIESFSQQFPIKPRYSIVDLSVKLAVCAKEAGLDGVVCSPEEVSAIRHEVDKDFLIFATSVRPKWAPDPLDQKRYGTPEQAIHDGATNLIMGRIFTDPPGRMSPLEIVGRVSEDIRKAL